MNWARAVNRKLETADLIRQPDGTLCFVQYVNSSGAYVVPLMGIHREIKGRDIEFSAGGRTISALSVVELVDPMNLGGNSQEYARYDKMLRALGENGMAKRKGAPVGVFIQNEDDLDDGQPSESVTETPDTEGNDMAKKAAGAKKTAVGAKKAAAPKREKAPKTVRKCACSCGTETTGFFAPGHDARMHGWIKKLETGKIEAKEVPAAVRAKLGLTEKKDGGYKVAHPHFWKD